jgi:choline dehydrogenase-like flavoprotein
MEGTISLGIFDSNDKLVRVLHRESKIDNFTIDENALKTTWDGKSDAGEDLPAGKYRARGYLVTKLKVEDLGNAASAPTDATDHISVKLVTNPLVADTRAVMEVTAGFDDKGTYLETMDHLPLATIRSFSNVTRIVFAKDSEKTIDVWLDEEKDEAPNLEHLRVSNIDKMMAFDCGFFELR